MNEQELNEISRVANDLEYVVMDMYDIDTTDKTISIEENVLTTLGKLYSLGARTNKDTRGYCEQRAKELDLKIS